MTIRSVAVVHPFGIIVDVTVQRVKLLKRVKLLFGRAPAEATTRIQAKDVVQV